MWVNCQYEEVADQDDLMGVEDTAKRDILCSVVCEQQFNIVCVCVAVR